MPPIVGTIIAQIIVQVSVAIVIITIDKVTEKYKGK